jgi:hypothetical protein
MKNSQVVLAKKEGEDRKKVKMLLIMLYINFLTPLLVTIMYI